ncbi:MAG: hypothetical protein ABJB40_04980 [Acidobacteriota bacterium]
MVTKIRFFLYYSKFLLTTAFGFHETVHPWSMRWRWQSWQRWNEAERKMRHQRNELKLSGRF